jgi:hypothetical protein
VHSAALCGPVVGVCSAPYKHVRDGNNSDIYLIEVVAVTVHVQLQRWGFGCMLGLQRMRIIMCSSSTGVGTATHQASSKKKSFLIDDILQLEKKKERSLHSLDGSATNRQKVPPFCPHLPSPSAQNGYVPVVTQSFSSTHAAYGTMSMSTVMYTQDLDTSRQTYSL